jgi:rfaE bifunctional protein kinase chain/domain
MTTSHAQPLLPPLPTAARLAQARVLVVGDAMLDRYWFGSVERISPEAPVPVVAVQREEDRVGGAANVALNVRRLGAQATLLSVAGADAAAHTLRQLLADADVDTALAQEEGLRTIVKLRVVGRAQQLLRADFDSVPGAAALAQLKADFTAALPLHDVVLFSDYGKGALADVAALIALARAAGKPVLVDPKGRDYARYAGATALTPNRGELQLAMGHWANESDLARQAQAFRSGLALGALLVTRAEEGMSLFDDQAAALHVPAQARQVFDVTGAGDTVIAALAALVAAGLPLRQAVPWANRAGGIVVSRFGTASVTYDELQSGEAA